MNHVRVRGHRWRCALLAGLCAAPAAGAGSALAQTGDWQEDALARARAVHLETLPEDCDLPGTRPESDAAETAYPIRIGETDAQREALLVEFPCFFGAYNLVYVYVLADQDGNAAPVPFPNPVLDVRYADGDAQTVVEAVTISEIADRREVFNPQFDPETLTLEANGKWRGLADAFDVTRWAFRDGAFRIVYFAVDASFDFEITPVVLIDEEIR
jgi:hypothetical protein